MDSDKGATSFIMQQGSGSGSFRDGDTRSALSAFQTNRQINPFLVTDITEEESLSRNPKLFRSNDHNSPVSKAASSASYQAISYIFLLI